LSRIGRYEQGSYRSRTAKNLVKKQLDLRRAEPLTGRQHTAKICRHQFAQYVSDKRAVAQAENNTRAVSVHEAAVLAVTWFGLGLLACRE